MIGASKTILLLVLLTVAESEAQVTASTGPVMGFGSVAVSQLAPNTLVLGSGTTVSYDSNAVNSQPPIANVEYTFFPQIGLNLARPRWDALISFVPGFSYSSKNLPQYQAVSLMSAVTLQYRASQKLSLNFGNSLVSSTNPFDSLTPGYQPGQGAASTSTGTALNYLPKTNEIASANAAYSLSARTSLTALASYNYVDYQHDPNIPDAAQPFQQSNSAQVSLGVLRNSTPRYQRSVQYFAQFLDSGHGLIKTLGQSVQYAVQYSPQPTLRLSAMIGPEYVQNTYAGILGGGADLVNERASGWSWTGNAAMTWTRGKNQLSASASRQLSLGTQYQGNVQEILLHADFHHQLPGRTDLTVFGGYNINKPVFVAQSVPRFSNDYLSTGVTLNKTIGMYWGVGIAYWYLLQDSQQNVGGLYSGDHNRVAISLSYSIAKALTR
jgi:hypothetical protein